MADIILAGDSFSLKKLRNAAEQLEDAQNLMQKVYDAVFSTSFWAEANPFALLDGSKNMNVLTARLMSCIPISSVCIKKRKRCAHWHSG